MSKVFSKLFILSLVLFFVFGCGWIQSLRSSNSNLEDKTRDTLGLKKTGIPECDEVVDILAKKSKGNTNGEEESWSGKAVTELVKQQIYNYLNDGNANKSPKEKAEMAQNCKTALGYLKDDQKK